MNHTLNSLTILNKIIEKIDGAYAPSTIRAYRANFERFIQFCEIHNFNALPANPSNVANYIAYLSNGKLKSSSIRIALASISSIHKLNQFYDPAQHPDVRIEIRRMHRKLGRSSQQAFGITSSLLEKMLSATGNDLRGLRDRALLLVAYDSMCRRSELVSLRIEDINVSMLDDQMRARICLRKSKNDQESNGRYIALRKISLEAITAWINKARIAKGYLFRGINNAFEITPELKCGQINRIFKRLAKDANTPKETINQISGHSLRVGASQDLLRSGASMPIIMNRGRWSKADTVMRYLENTSFEFGEN